MNLIMAKPANFVDYNCHPVHARGFCAKGLVHSSQTTARRSSSSKFGLKTSAEEMQTLETAESN